MKETRVKGINGEFGSFVLTNLLLLKNLKNHYENLKIVDNNKEGSLNKYVSPYGCFKDLLEGNPHIGNTIAIMQDREITYGELWIEIEKLSVFFEQNLNWSIGENVSVCSASSIEGIVAFFALNRLGLVNARIFNGCKEEKMRCNINNFDSRIILTDENNLSVLSNVIRQTKIETVILLSSCSEKRIQEFTQLHPMIHIFTYKEIMIGSREENMLEGAVSSGDTASILYTSGSSGEPKPISIPNRVYTNMVDVVCKTTNIKKCDGERVVSVVSHEYPYAAINCTVMVLLMGKTLIMPQHNKEHSIDFEEILRAKPNRIQAIPNFYKLLERAKNSGQLKILDLSFLNSIISGGERYLNNEKKEMLGFLEDCNVKPLLIDGFGFGEMGSATALKFGLSEYFLLMNGIEAKAIDPKTGEELSTDCEGILCFTGPTIADGYYNNVEATEKSFVTDRNGKKWFISDTFGMVHGKRKRLIKLGGRIREYFITDDGAGNFVKVYAGSVEDVIMACPYVKDCIVVPSDNGAIPTPVAFFSIMENETMNETDIIQSVKSKCECLENFMQPTKYILETTIRRTSAGKKDYTYYKEKTIRQNEKK